MTSEEYLRDVEEVRLHDDRWQLTHKPTGASVMAQSKIRAKEYLLREVASQPGWDKTHLISWDVRVDRRWFPFFTTEGRFEENPIPPVGVSINVTFDDDKAARAFEAKVRELLEAA